jgi:ubiquinone/menaquinone biosynthesis C-methylase UbiE
MDYEA